MLINKIYDIRSHNHSFKLAKAIKGIVNVIIENTEDYYKTYQPISIDVAFCPLCKKTGILLNDEGIQTAIELIKANELDQITIILNGDNIELTFDCKHEVNRIISINNPIVSIYGKDGKIVTKTSKYNYYAPTSKINLSKVILAKDYEEAIDEYTKFLNYDAKAIWKNKKEWILISEPEIYFQDIFLARLEYMFVDGRLMHDHPLAGGELDFLIEGESLDKPVLIEMK